MILCVFGVSGFIRKRQKRRRERGRSSTGWVGFLVYLDCFQVVGVTVLELLCHQFYEIHLGIAFK